MEILVVGAGSLGSLVGGLLAADHEVTLVGREPHVGTVGESGLRITGALDRTARPAARTDVPGAAELAVVTVKSFDTRAAAEALADCSLEAALSLQNGMGNEELLAEALAAPVLAGTCTYGARIEEPGVVACTGVGEVALGPPGGGDSELARRVGAALKSGLSTTVATDMPRRLWEKLAVNCGINAPTALAGLTNGALVDGPAGETARAATREAGRVARQAGVDLDGEVSALEEVAGATAANASSMLQDVRAERRTEIDAINGYVVETAGEPTPVNATLAGLVRGWESERDLREKS